MHFITKHFKELSRKFLLLATFILTLTSVPVHAQISQMDTDAVTSNSTKEIAIAPSARDAQIADRLTRILNSSGWFSLLEVSVNEGIVFLDGQTETEERQEWARQLALRTQDVVAVVNRIKVQPKISWDLTPTWRELERLVDQAQSFAPLMVISLIILLIFLLLSRGVARLARHTLQQRMSSPLLISIAARVMALPVTLIGIYLVLQIAGLTGLAVTVLGGTGLVGIVFGLAFREIAENSLASILLSARNPFRTGDWIQVGEYQGIVQNLNMRTTILLTLDGNHVQIPNSLVFRSVLTNFSTNPNRRVEFIVGIGYDDSIVMAQDVIVNALRTHPAVLDDPEPIAIVNALEASTVNISVQFWFDGKAYSFFKVRSSLMRQIKRALQDAGVSMPDAAREIIFPKGVQVYHNHTEKEGINEEGLYPTVEAETVDERATISAGEGNLDSEHAELKRQAMTSDLPENKYNLLSSPDNRPVNS